VGTRAEQIRFLAAFTLVAIGIALSACGSGDGGSSPEDIKQRGRLVAGVKYDVPLFGELRPGATAPQGFEVDLVRELAKRMLGDPAAVDWVQVDSASRIPALQDGEIDLVCATLTVTDERREQIDFSDAYFTAGQSLLVKEGSPIRSIDDLEGKRVSTTRGSTSVVRIRELAPDAVVQEYDGFSNAFMALQMGGADAMTSDNTILWGYATEHEGFEMVGGLLTEESYALGFQKGNGGLVAYVNAFLKDIKADGTYDALCRKWFPEAVAGQ
jgi:putative glutamine transport system substrate-binding protein